MWLINIDTMQLEDFTLRAAPHYAILSHTWADDEVTFQEFTSPDNNTAKKQGYIKIVETCEIARTDNLKYAWVDTCCIDKTNPTELAEAINSMFKWYKNSSVCYAFLADFSQKPNDAEVSKAGGSKDHCDPSVTVTDPGGFASSRWFTRGWTLQELIAPKTVHFYDESWAFRGGKDDYASAIHQITRIDPRVLKDSTILAQISVAERMTWAAERQTSRSEDIAYCLLGIFDVSMPLLYGEGDKAFLRLQQEIIKNTNDLTIFGWSPKNSLIYYHLSSRDGPLDPKGCSPDCGHGKQYTDGLHGILATSVKDFVGARSWKGPYSSEHAFTNQRIKIYCSLIEVCIRGCTFAQCTCCSDCRKYVLPVVGAGKRPRLAVILEKLGPDQFARSNQTMMYMDLGTFLSSSRTTQRPIYLLTHNETLNLKTVSPSLPLRVQKGWHYTIKCAAPADRWNSCLRSWYLDLYPKGWGMVSLDIADLEDREVCVIFCSLTPYIVDPSAYKREIWTVSRSATDMSTEDILDLFDLRDKNEVMDKGKVVARIEGSAWNEIILHLKLTLMGGEDEDADHGGRRPFTSEANMAAMAARNTANSEPKAVDDSLQLSRSSRPPSASGLAPIQLKTCRSYSNHESYGA